MSWTEDASNPFTIVDARRIQMSSSHLSSAEINSRKCIITFGYTLLSKYSQMPFERYKLEQDFISIAWMHLEAPS